MTRHNYRIAAKYCAIGAMVGQFVQMLMGDMMGSIHTLGFAILFMTISNDLK